MHPVVSTPLRRDAEPQGSMHDFCRARWSKFRAAARAQVRGTDLRVEPVEPADDDSALASHWQFHQAPNDLLARARRDLSDSLPRV